jgi:hypothetical protein
MRVSEKTVLRMVFGTAKEEVTEEWRKLHGKVFHDYFFTKNYSGNEIKENERGEDCGTSGAEVKCTQDLERGAGN